MLGWPINSQCPVWLKLSIFNHLIMKSFHGLTNLVFLFGRCQCLFLTPEGFFMQRIRQVTDDGDPRRLVAVSCQ